MLKYFNRYHDFLLMQKMVKSNDLFKIYLCRKNTKNKEKNKEKITFKEFAGKNFFIDITLDNINDIKINPNYPLLNYSSKVIKQLLKEKRIREKNVINLPYYIKLSSLKKEFYKFIGEDIYLPKTVYNIKDAIQYLKFPVIAKPSSGHSGIGIKVFYSKKELEEFEQKEKFDLFSEYIEKVEEHRFFNYKGEPIFWMERIPLNEKAKNGRGEINERTKFKYIKKDINYIPDDMLIVLKRFCNKMKDLPFICFDLLRAKNGQIYVIESNAQPGLPFDSTIIIYKKIFEDFYGRPIDRQTEEILNLFAQKLINGIF